MACPKVTWRTGHMMKSLQSSDIKPQGLWTVKTGIAASWVS